MSDLDDHERRIAALEVLMPKAVLDMIYRDPHQWHGSTVPYVSTYLNNSRTAVWLLPISKRAQNLRSPTPSHVS